MAPGPKQELWLKVHREKIPCPLCHKVMSRRAIRWRHVCKGLKEMSQEEKEERQRKYAEMTLACFQERVAT